MENNSYLNDVLQSNLREVNLKRFPGSITSLVLSPGNKEVMDSTKILFMEAAKKGVFFSGRPLRGEGLAIKKNNFLRL